LLPQAEIRVLGVRVSRVVVVVMVVTMSGSECGTRKHRQKQGSEENLFHATNVARSRRNE